MHRAGVAGLWMTLDAFDGDAAKLADPIREVGGSWTREAQGVVLRWSGDPALFFRELIATSFRLDERGLVYFPALGRPSDHLGQATVLQRALIGTYLQHGKTRGAGSEQVVTRGDEDAAEPPLRYRPLSWYAHQRAAADEKGKPARWTLDPGGTLTPVAGWLVPGGAVRHVGLGGSTALSEPTGRYLALLYAPIGAYYVELQAQTQRVRPQFSLVLPEVIDLKRYARARRRLMSEPARAGLAAGGAQAALRILGRIRAEEAREDLRVMHCRVVDFGRVAWVSNQTVRISLYDVNPDALRGLDAFQAADAVFVPRVATSGAGERFWVVPQMPEMIARNAIHGRAWWSGFAEFVADLERRKAVMGEGGRRGERREMATLVQEQAGAFEDAEAIFVEACHEAWRRRMGAMGERARGQRLDFSALVQREFEQQRVTFAHCKDAATFRQAITDFWSRGGSSKPLRGGWRSILPFLDERQWRAGRDLALLALVSYRPDEEEKDPALNSTPGGQGGNP